MLIWVVRSIPLSDISVAASTVLAIPDPVSALRAIGDLVRHDMWFIVPHSVSCFLGCRDFVELTVCSNTLKISELDLHHHIPLQPGPDIILHPLK